MKIVTLILLILTAILTILQFVHWDSDVTETVEGVEVTHDRPAKYIHIVTYLAVLLPLWTSYKQKKWGMITLLLTIVTVHAIDQTCNDFGQCVPGFDLIKDLDNATVGVKEALQRQEINNILTVFSFMHLFAHISESDTVLANLTPLLILSATLGIFIDQAALVLIIISLFSTARALMRFADYSLVDFLLFMSAIIAAIVFFFLNHRGFFYVFYTLAFAFASTIRKSEDAHHILGLIPKGSQLLPTRKGAYGQGSVGLSRVDLQ